MVNQWIRIIFFITKLQFSWMFLQHVYSGMFIPHILPACGTSIYADKPITSSKAQVSAPHMYERSHLILYTLLVASKERKRQYLLHQLSHEVQVLMSSCPVYLRKTQPNFWLQNTAVVSTNQAKICIPTPKNQAQGPCTCGPRNISWFAKKSHGCIDRKDSCRGNFPPGRFIQAILVNQTCRKIYTEPDLNKSKFPCPACLRCSLLGRSERL